MLLKGKMNWLNDALNTVGGFASKGAELYKSVTGAETQNKVTEQLSGAEQTRVDAQAKASLIWPVVAGVVVLGIGVSVAFFAFRRRPSKA